MAGSIHPTAFIAENVQLGDSVTVGPFAVIESGAVIGDHCQIGSHAIVHGRVRMGVANILHPHAILGGLPQDLGFKAETDTSLVIGDRNVFREGFTAHRATVLGSPTLIGSDCYFMNNSHVAHDCAVGNKTIFANNVAIGGFVEVGNNVFMGGAVVVHQFCRVGSYAIVQGTTGINMNVIPFTLIGGRPAKHYRLNLVGLRRAGITGDNLKLLSAAFRMLKNKESIENLTDSDEIRYLKEWLAAENKRGIHGFKELED
jgi:UDP-N-acetylglucosamine acyltransferase